ncbi:hypothetical protein SDC9_142125 [bioreactor metagenome]|uniref:Uncharacterized protein n=1 Tax=bioreactor metagenome TaxID=1076179 RepID=A0A645E072_9ZZZZ
MAHFAVHAAHMANGLHDVAGSRLTLGPDHRCAFGYAPQRLAQILRPADKGDAKAGLVDVEHIVGGREHLALVDVVNFKGLQDLGLHKVPDAHLGHHRDGHRLLNAPNHFWVAHPGNAPGRPDIRRDALQGHHGAGTRLLGDFRLLGGGHVHDNPTLEHLS